MKSRIVGMCLVAILLVMPLALAIPARAGTAFTFTLIQPNVAEAPAAAPPSVGAGDRIRVTGSGAFDTGAMTVVASGSFTHTDPSGAVVARGAWVATAFIGFDNYGGSNPGGGPGWLGGELTIVVTLFPTGGSPVPGLQMTVLCELGNVPDGKHEGVTVGPFTKKIMTGAGVFGAITVFHTA